MKNYKIIGFYSNTGPDPLKKHKGTKPAFMLGHHRHANETPIKWHFVGRPMLVRILWFFDPLSSHQLEKRCQSWTHSGKTFWIRTCLSQVYNRTITYELFLQCAYNEQHLPSDELEVWLHIPSVEFWEEEQRKPIKVVKCSKWPAHTSRMLLTCTSIE